MRARLLLIALLAGALLLAACGDDDDDTPSGGGESGAGTLADRVLRIGESLGTQMRGVVAALPEDLQLALNPDAASVIESAVADADDRLDIVAGAAGMAPDAFADLWRSNRVEAFGRFADGATEQNDEGNTALDELFITELVALPVHPDGVLLGSVHAVRPDGEQLFFISYDVTLDDPDVEETIARQLDQSPWQVTGGQSGEDLSVIGFQSTITGDITGSAFVQPILLTDTGAQVEAEGDEDAGADGESARDQLTGVIYVIVVSPLDPTDAPDFELRASRPLPGGFPVPALIFEDETVLSVNWASGPGTATYQLTLLSPRATFDVVDEYREVIFAEGYDITNDQAQGFATVIDFGLPDGTVVGTLTVDEFAQDDSLTAVVLQIQTNASPTN